MNGLSDTDDVAQRQLLAHRDFASRIQVCNAPKADKPEPTRMTHSGHAAQSTGFLR
jgi:hypothetical protein